MHLFCILDSIISQNDFFVKYILHYVLNIYLFVIHVIQADSPLSHFDLLRLKVLIRILLFPLQEPTHSKSKNKQEQRDHSQDTGPHHDLTCQMSVTTHLLRHDGRRNGHG